MGRESDSNETDKAIAMIRLLKSAALLSFIILCALWPKISLGQRVVGNSVGTIDGHFSVTEAGGASYTVNIDCPTAAGGITPELAILYNSQSGTGILGNGTDISGISVISLGKKSIFYDGKNSGRTHSLDDAYYLNGQRLLHTSGRYGHPGSTYQIAGDPKTTVRFYGEFTPRDSILWMEVKTSDGHTLTYGKTADSRLAYKNTLQKKRTCAWYICKVENALGFSAEYTYTESGLMLYPSAIKYGMKDGLSTCTINSVTFDYADLSGSISEHTVEDQRSGINRLLQTISLKIGDNIWRKYNFSYNGTNTDFAPTLKSVQVQNHLGETLKPTEFQWNEIPMKNLVSKEANIDTELPLKFDQTEKDGTIYQAVDFNGDGISDIVKIYSEYFKNGNNFYDNSKYDIAIFLSQNNGVYADTTVYEDIRTIGSLFETSIDFHGQSIVDFDGDGISDILVPTTEFKKAPYTSVISLDLILGKDIVSKRRHIQQYSFPLSSSADSIFFVSGDINDDDKDEFIYFENKLNNNSKCIGKIVTYNAGNFSLTDLFLTMPYSPKKGIISDFNNNGLSDLILFHEKGCCIFFNKGADNINGIFDSEPSYKHYSNDNFSRWETCDMNGDGLVDFVSTSEQGKKLVVHYNQGNGTFRKEIQDLDLSQNTSTEQDLLLSFDINNSGRTDLILIRENGNRNYSFYTIFNTLNGLKLNRQVNFSSDKKLQPGHLTVGSFSRSGCAELMSFGLDLTSPSQQKQDTKLRYYRLAQSSSGKLNRVVDGLGNITTIGYGISSNTSHAQKIGSATIIGGMATSTVTSATIHNSNGVLTGSNSYSFKNIVFHTQGLGFLGFNETSVKNNLSGEHQHTVIANRDPSFLFPTIIETNTSLGEYSSQNIRHFQNITDQPNNLLCVLTSEENTDYDGITKRSTFRYSHNGNLEESSTKYGSEKFYTLSKYDNYVNCDGVEKPTKITKTQKVDNDRNPYVQVTEFEYSNNGLITKQIDNAGTDKAITKTYEYDVFGNITQELVSWDSIVQASNLFRYDLSGNMLTEESLLPAGALKKYSHDEFGQIVSETDATNSQNLLVTSYLLDGWGNRIKISYPDNSVATRSVVYSPSSSGAYTITERIGSDSPVYFNYDSNGQLISKTTKGIGDIHLNTVYTYDSFGNVIKVDNTSGKHTSSLSYTYDCRNRILSERNNNNGHQTNYEYAKLFVQKKIYYPDNGRVRTHATYFNPMGHPIRYVSDGVDLYHMVNSMGKTMSYMTPDGHNEFEYDQNGNCTYATELFGFAGQITQYAPDGKILSHADAQGFETTYSYDELGLLQSVTTPNRVINHEYGTSGFDILKLVRSSDGYNSILFSHDKFGRIESETREFSDGKVLGFSYEYGDNSRLKSKTYPNGLKVNYVYDSQGNMVEVLLDSISVSKLVSYDGIQSVHKFLDQISIVEINDLERARFDKWVSDSTSMLFDISVEYDRALSRTKSRCGFTKFQERETFAYDSLDRLTKTTGIGGDVEITYNRNGSIKSKTGIGNYTYNAFPFHAVKEIENSSGNISSLPLHTVYNELGLIEEITDEATGYSMSFEYGPDQKRWKSELRKHGEIVRTIRYANEYEEVTKGNTIRRFYYLEGGNLVLQTLENSTLISQEILHLLTDNQGSILKVVDGKGNIVFETYYDAWGAATVIDNSIGLTRGYTGHEMMPEFSLINLNGRLYDPQISQFLSPDNVIQSPSDYQSHNRYSYCLNNPLIYTDPSGESWLSSALLGAVGFISGYLFNGIETHHWGWSSVKVGLSSAAFAVLGDLGGGSASLLNKSLSVVANNALSHVKPISASLNSHVTLSMFPIINFGTGGNIFGMGMGVDVSHKKWNFQASIGTTSKYFGWNFKTTYDDYGASYGMTFYNAGNFHGSHIGGQITGTAAIYAHKFAASFTNDALGDGQDRWRTTAEEISWGRYSIGSYVDTNWGEGEGNGKYPKDSDEALAPSPVGKNHNPNCSAWINGIVHRAPLWIGIRQGNQIHRLGYSHPQIQNLTQNLIHKYKLGNQSFYKNYSNFKTGIYISTSSTNRFSLWP